MSSEILRRNQVDLDKIKLQKREWYYRNRKSVLKQQKTSEKKREYQKEWYLKNRDQKIQKSLKWTEENPEQRRLHIQKYVQKNSAKTKFWKPYNIPDHMQLEWIENFGRLETFDPSKGKLSKRLTLKIADLKDSNLIIIHHHYLHRSRTMGQLPYWICIDEIPVGVISYSLPRISNQVDGIEPMNLLKLARLWINPSVQNLSYEDRNGKSHSLSVASCAMGKSIKRVKTDWYMKYPNLPKIDAVISWSDDKRHKGTIYKSSNFKVSGKSGGNSHGNGKRKDSGNYIPHKDFRNIKTRFLYKFPNSNLPVVTNSEEILENMVLESFDNLF
jgi:hypothetical protein